ncbi:MAG: chorismate-binding protein, partial [Deltaproteobacteria bacterium]
MYQPTLESFKKLTQKGNLIPVYHEILADKETPVSVLTKLLSQEHVFLLESVEGGEKWGRYTFLGTNPRMTFRIKKDVVEMEEGEKKQIIEHYGEPLAILKSILGRYKPVSLNELPRFFGGAVGYLGYDMVSFFEDKLKKDQETTTIAPIDDAVFFITDTLIIFDNVRHTIKILACALLDDETNVAQAYQDAIVKIEKIQKLLSYNHTESIDPVESQQHLFQSNMTPAKFKEMVNCAKEYIQNGDIIQVVLSQCFYAEQGLLKPENIYRALRFINPSPYLFFLKIKDFYLIGSSPESMVRLENNITEVRPIAGTRRRGKTEQEDRILADDLLNDPKERAEHVMLVDLGRNDLGRTASIGSVQVNQYMTVERYSHVMHLVSNVQAELADGKDAFDVMMGAFPAGTLSGAPKVRAMEIIDELEPNNRGAYGGG